MAKAKEQPEVEEVTAAEPQGEVVVDKGAKADVLGGGIADPEEDARVLEQNQEEAKQSALDNTRAEREANKS